jgi:hypothetical protein
MLNYYFCKAEIVLCLDKLIIYRHKFTLFYQSSLYVYKYV